jgi:hypothetical protein
MGTGSAPDIHRRPHQALSAPGGQKSGKGLAAFKTPFKNFFSLIQSADKPSLTRFLHGRYRITEAFFRGRSPLLDRDLSLI